MSKPQLPVDERRTEVLQVRLKKSEKAELEAGAIALGVSVGALMRTSGLEKARRRPLARGKKYTTRKVAMSAMEAGADAVTATAVVTPACNQDGSCQLRKSEA